MGLFDRFRKPDVALSHAAEDSHADLAAPAVRFADGPIPLVSGQESSPGRLPTGGIMIQLGAEKYDAIPEAIHINPGEIRFDTQTGEIASLDPSVVPKEGISAFAPTAGRFADQHIPLRDGGVDYVMQTGFYIGGYANGLAELNRVLKIGGEVWSRYDQRGPDYMTEAPPIGGGRAGPDAGTFGFERAADVLITPPGPAQGLWSVYRKSKQLGDS